jgi:hypothetical protein
MPKGAYTYNQTTRLDAHMKSQGLVAIGLMLLSLAATADQSIYCPQKQGYITLGMTPDQVISACGQPIMKRDSNTQVFEKIPVTQIIYTTLNQGAVYPGLNNLYQRWSLPSGSTGTSLRIDVMNQKVVGININGSATNAVSICGGVSIQSGDTMNKVLATCGSPSMVNQTYINQPIPKSQKPEIWVYQVDQYQAPFSLTFFNGKLQSIN